MNGVLRLTQNEIIKITRQLSWRIMALILMVIVIGYPILVNLMSEVNRSYYSMDFEKAAQDASSEVTREYYLTKANVQKFFDEKGLTRQNWQYSNFFYSYDSVCEKERGLELIAEEGKDPYEVQEVFYLDTSREYNMNGELVNIAFNSGKFDAETGEYIYDSAEKPFTAESAAELLEEVRKEKKYIEDQIDSPFSEYIKQTYTVDIEGIKAEYEAAKAEYEERGGSFKAYDAARLKYEAAQKLSNSIEKLITYSDDLTGMEELTYIHILNQANNYINDVPNFFAKLSEKEFNESNHGYGYYFLNLEYNDYDSYSKAADIMQKEFSEAEELIAYSIENNKPIDYLTANSTRDILDSSLGINMAVLMFFAIFMGAVIISSEHSSGAVRLLLIRPRARWKILLSKLFCLLFFLVSMTVLTSVISFIEMVIIYGWNDLSVPYLMHSGTGVYEVAPIFYYIFKNFVGILPSLLIMCFALFMSVATKRSIFALAISLLANVFGGAVSSWLYNVIRTSAQWLRLTPIPFFSLSDCFPDPIGTTMHWSTPALYGITLEQGAPIMLIYSAIIIAVTFVIFEKQQIK